MLPDQCSRNSWQSRGRCDLRYTLELLKLAIMSGVPAPAESTNREEPAGDIVVISNLPPSQDAEPVGPPLHNDSDSDSENGDWSDEEDELDMDDEAGAVDFQVLDPGGNFVNADEDWSGDDEDFGDDAGK